jgi:hypothetical protein
MVPIHLRTVKINRLKEALKNKKYAFVLRCF